jgi:multidrug resistance efflux pump
MKKIIIVVVLVAVTVAAYFGYQQIQAQQVEATAVTEDSLRVDTGIDQVMAEGRIIPLHEAHLSAQTAGLVTELFVPEGAIVDAGDTLLQLDTTDEQIIVRQANAGVTQAEANLETAQAGLLLAQLSLDVAHLSVRSAEADLALIQSGPTTAQIVLTERNVAVAEAAVNQAANSVSLVTEGASAAQIAAAQAQVTAAQKAYDNALKIYQPILQDENSNEADREQASLLLSASLSSLNSAQAALNALLAGATNAERNAAAGGVIVASNQRDAAAAQLDLLMVGTRAETIAIARASLQQAQDMVHEAELSVAIGETAVTQAGAALAEAKDALAAAEYNLSKRTLVAPIAGTVVVINAKVGEVAQAGMPIIVLADFSQWVVETTDLTELDVVEVAQGLAAALEIDAFPGETLSGVVTDISSISANVLGDVTYRVTVEVTDDQGLPLRWGMTAVVDVDTTE